MGAHVFEGRSGEEVGRPPSTPTSWSLQASTADDAALTDGAEEAEGADDGEAAKVVAPSSISGTQPLRTRTKPQSVTRPSMPRRR